MKKLTKSQSQRIHAKKRATQRYGIELNKEKHKDLVSRIQNNKDVIFLEKQSNRISVFAILQGSIWVPVVYDRERKTIVSFLPIKSIDENGYAEIIDKATAAKDEKIPYVKTAKYLPGAILKFYGMVKKEIAYHK